MSTIIGLVSTFRLPLQLVGTQPIPSSLLGQYPAPYSANTEPIPGSPTIQITIICKNPIDK